MGGNLKKVKKLLYQDMGELHLFVYCERIKREYGVEIIVGNLTINYRETIG